MARLQTFQVVPQMTPQTFQAIARTATAGAAATIQAIANGQHRPAQGLLQASRRSERQATLDQESRETGP